MIFTSIRWRLQIWYGLILVAVLTGFGVTAYQLERGRVLRRVDDELLQRANALTMAMRPPPRGRGPEDFPPDGGRPGPFREPPPPGEEPPDRDQRPRRDFHLPPHVARLFESETNGYFYIIRSRNGDELARSDNVPTPEYHWENGPFTTVNNLAPFHPPVAPVTRSRGPFRETFVITPPGEKILVGHYISIELHDLQTVGLTLFGVGAVILLLGLAGGWWLAARSIRPIEDISATAVKISAGDLSQRIRVAETESELGRLADVLNATFARLDAAFAQQKQFASDAAHELRTPVTVMLTQTQTALNRDRSAPEYRQTLEACQRAAQRMRRLIESLLQLARLDAGQEQLKRLRFDLANVAADCAELVRPLAAERGLRLECDVVPMPCDGDPERLAQVITNLVTNAIQYNTEHGEVRLSGAAQNGAAVLRVTDTGAGIAPEDLPRVFDRFYRADTSRSSANAGLGLAISKAIVEAHGGTIEVASEPGKGTTFTLRLPQV